ncbi:MAG: PRC-barrel domain-containing protein [Bauldia sp.]|nr:PRC-barrel domain-containing protein [Bauldia sp.]
MRMIALAVAAMLVGVPATHAQVTAPAGAAIAGPTRANAAGFIEYQAADELLVTDLLGRAVFNLAEESLGTVDDIVYSYEGDAVALVVGVGGFLGIGVKNVAIAYDAVALTMDGDELRLVVDASREALDAAAAFQTLDERDLTPMVPAEPVAIPTATPPAGAMITLTPAPVPAAPAPTPVVPVEPATPPATAVAPAEGPMVITAPPMVIAMPALDAPTNFVAMQDIGEMLVTEIIGHPVYNLAGEVLGNIDNVLQGRDGTITAVIVGVGGFLGIGVKDVAIAMEALNVGVIDGEWRFVFDADRAALDAAPAFQRLP